MFEGRITDVMRCGGRTGARLRNLGALTWARLLTPRGSAIPRKEDARAIAHHYDVSNAFYRMWLDARMVYSCAYFHDRGRSLDDAQAQKLDHICRKLRLAAGRALSRHRLRLGRADLHGRRAARRAGDRRHAVARTSTTREGRIAQRRLTGRVRVELLDYPDLPEDEAFDKIASVGMFEHVGLRNADAISARSAAC